MHLILDLYITKNLSHRDQPLWGYVSEIKHKPIINNTLYDKWIQISKYENLILIYNYFPII